MVGKSDPHKIKNKNHILVQSIRVTPKPFETLPEVADDDSHPAVPLQCV